MADLLECVIQIKALADTPRRLALRLHEAEARGAVTRADSLFADLAAYESWLRAAVEVGLSGQDGRVEREPRPPASPGAPPGSSQGETRASLEDFARRRAALVRVLDGCSAAQLSTTVLVADRGPTTIADLVALALAHDTDTIARIVRDAG